MTTTTPPGIGGFFSLFNLPATVFRTEVLEALGNAMARAMLPAAGKAESGYVYLGQFIAHDVSRLNPPTRPFVPCWELEQLRTPALDLDCVYGDDLRDVPIDTATGKLQLGRVVDSLGHAGSEDDLPRTFSGRARIGDDRNDENLLLAQLHVQFLKLHNFFVDSIAACTPGLAAKALFEQAREQLILHYHQVVLYDFLEKILDPVVWEHVVLYERGSIWEPVGAEAPRMPIEFAAAAFRFGHSMVRLSYNLNDTEPANIPLLFNMTGTGGGFGDAGALPESLVVDWRRFFNGHTGERPIGGNVSHRIDPDVPIILGDGVALATKNLITGNRSLLPDAQTIVRHLLNTQGTLAAAVNLQPLQPNALNPVVYMQDRGELPLLDVIGNDHGLERKTPLWYYLLAEAHAQAKGQHLGTLGSLLVSGVLRALVRLSAPSPLARHFVSQYITPTKIVPVTARFPNGRALCMNDLLSVIR